MTNLTVGGKYWVRFTRNNVFEWQNGCLEMECELMHYPCGEGDHFQFKVGSYEFSVNPLCTDFVGIFKQVNQ